jgi:hypothetical protein
MGGTTSRSRLALLANLPPCIRLRLRPVGPVQRPVLNRFAQMLRLDILDAHEIRYGAHFQDPVMRLRGKPRPGNGFSSSFSPSAEMAENFRSIINECH